MSTVSNTNMSAHQIGMTVCWSFMYNFSVLFALVKHVWYASYIHAGIASACLLLTLSLMMELLIPYGFDPTIQDDGYLVYIHAIFGFVLLSYIVFQVIVGFYLKMQQINQIATSQKIVFQRKIHQISGYTLSTICKLNVMILWFPRFEYWALIIWQVLFSLIIIYLKYIKPKLQETFTEQSKENEASKIQKISKIEEISKAYPQFIIFADRVYNLEPLKKHHPAGYQVVQSVKGRQIDRFLFGMYSSQALPSVKMHSHSSKSIKLLGPPIAKLNIPPPYSGFTKEYIPVKIKYKQTVSAKGKIYLLGLVPQNSELFNFQGYTHLSQIGQYYSLTVNNKTTRLYTSLNCLHYKNAYLMNELFPSLDLMLKLIKIQQKHTPKQQQLSTKKSIMQNSQSIYSTENILNFFPIMMKIYDNGKLTSGLLRDDFQPRNLLLSAPRGRGLQLQTLEPGKIIIIAGGTGLFPFMDFIDLLFKSVLIAENHKKSAQIIRDNQILKGGLFDSYKMHLMAAFNSPQDMHPLVINQLAFLSHRPQRFKITLRIKENQQILNAFESKICFTQSRFDKLIIQQAKCDKLSRIWLCGPPRMMTQTISILKASNFTQKDYLIV